MSFVDSLRFVLGGEYKPKHNLSQCNDEKDNQVVEKTGEDIR